MIAYRVSSYDTPCPPSPSRRAGRWGLRGDEVVNYWAVHPYTSWAEVYRFDGTDATTVHDVSKRLWVADLSHLEFLTLDDTTASRYGLTAGYLVADDHAACQAAAAALRADGHRNVLAPSAALDGTWNALLFSQRLAIPFTETPLDPDVDLPCAVAGDHSIGVPDVLDSVRHIGQASPGPFTHELPTPMPMLEHAT